MSFGFVVAPCGEIACYDSHLSGELVVDDGNLSGDLDCFVSRALKGLGFSCDDDYGDNLKRAARFARTVVGAGLGGGDSAEVDVPGALVACACSKDLGTVTADDLT